MRNRIYLHLRANVVSYLALALSMTGMAYAAATVGSADVINNSLRSKDLKNNAAVKSADVRDDTEVGGGLRSQDLANNTITGEDVLADALSGADLADFDDLKSSGLVTLDDPINGNDDTIVLLTSSDEFFLRGTCLKTVGPTRTAEIRVGRKSSTAGPYSVDSTAPGGANNGVDRGSNLTTVLASIGPTSDAEVGAGSYGVFTIVDPTVEPEAITGEVLVAVGVGGKDCSFMATLNS